MKKLAITLAFLSGITTCLFAQTSDSITTREIVVDKNMLDLIQLLHPEFYYSPDSAIFNKNLEKHLLNEMYLSNKATELNLINDSTLVANKDIFLDLAENLYWSSIVNKTNIEVPEITEEECLLYYNENQDKFMIPYIFDFWQTWILSPEDEKAAVKRLKSMAKSDKIEEIEKPKFSDASFTINFEYDRELQKSHDLYSQLVSTEINKVSEVIKIGEASIYVIPTKKVGGTPMDFEDVKHICLQHLIAIKLKKIEEIKQKEMYELFEIIISNDLNSN